MWRETDCCVPPTDAEEEEEEAKRLQKERAKSLREEDFMDDEDEEEGKEGKGEEESSSFSRDDFLEDDDEILRAKFAKASRDLNEISFSDPFGSRLFSLSLSFPLFVASDPKRGRKRRLTVKERGNVGVGGEKRCFKTLCQGKVCHHRGGGT